MSNSEYENLLGLAALKSRKDEEAHLSALVGSGDLDQSRLRFMAYGSLSAVSILGVEETMSAWKAIASAPPRTAVLLGRRAEPTFS